MADQTVSPYAPTNPSKSLRIIKPDPYNHMFSKWNIIRWFNYFLAVIIFIWAITDTNLVAAGIKIVIAIIQLTYYFTHLYNAKKMEETLYIWDFRKKALLNQNLVVKFNTDIEYLGDLFPLEEVIPIVPGLITLLKFKGNKYAVMWKVHTKNYDQSVIDEVELKVKKFLDGLQERLVFQSIWYSVDGHSIKTKKVIETASESPIHSKPKDMHIQALMAYVVTDQRPQNVVKHVYFQELGYCSTIEKAISQFNSIVPGIETILKSTFHDLERIVTVSDVYAIYREIWDTDEVTEW